MEKRLSVYNKIAILEKAESIFICSLCCDSKSSHSNNPFSTSTPSLFMEHQRCQHSSISEVECIYCCSHVPTSHMVQHVQNHFMLSQQDYCCPLCNENIRNNIMETVNHIKLKHLDEIACLYCKIKLNSVNDLMYHLENNKLVMYHCGEKDCLAMTHSKDVIQNHVKRKHALSYFRVDVQFVCSENGTQRSKCNCLMNLPIGGELGQINGSIRSNNNNLTVNSSWNLLKLDNINNNLPSSNLSLSVMSSDKKFPDEQYISLPYSGRVLEKLSKSLDDKLKSDLANKMEQYSTFKVRLELCDGQKQFVCAHCLYRSVHSLADVRKHILGCHCSVSTSYTRLCLRASRLDTNTFQLFSDKKLIAFANEKLKRSEPPAISSGFNDGNVTATDGAVQTNGSIGSQHQHLLEDSEPESDNQSETVFNGKSQKRGAKYSLLNGAVAKKCRTTADPDGTNGNSNNSFYQKGNSRIRFNQENRNSSNGIGAATNSMLHQLRGDSPIPEIGPPLPRDPTQEPIEREIPLNFSWTVLEQLVGDYCPTEYLPILHAKMKVYAAHKILLTRRSSTSAGVSPCSSATGTAASNGGSGGRRYFLCSHCHNSSPHGMNDIRKHILGVHARLPERFKAAAMYCSRMNRDNYALLPDNELLKKNKDVVRTKIAAVSFSGIINNSSPNITNVAVSNANQNSESSPSPDFSSRLLPFPAASHPIITSTANTPTNTINITPSFDLFEESNIIDDSYSNSNKNSFLQDSNFFLQSTNGYVASTEVDNGDEDDDVYDYYNNADVSKSLIMDSKIIKGKSRRSLILKKKPIKTEESTVILDENQTNMLQPHLPD